jgi:tRNA (guanine37-N1)-methyltransferase
MRIDIFTLFPVMFLGPLQESILKRAQERGTLSVYLHQIRDYALDRHQMTDDVPYGGGQGMVMRPEPIFRAVKAVVGEIPTPTVLLSPQGRQFNQAIAHDLAQVPRLALICGHYEGVDERVREHLVTDELSIGDYVLTGGELAAMVVIDAVARYIPGVLGADAGAEDDSFASGLLEGPQYTRPATFGVWEVPEILRSGNHAAVARWKRQVALRRTYERRPDLLQRADLSAEDRRMLDDIAAQASEPDAD